MACKNFAPSIPILCVWNMITAEQEKTNRLMEQNQQRNGEKGNLEIF